MYVVSIGSTKREDTHALFALLGLLNRCQGIARWWEVPLLEDVRFFSLVPKDAQTPSADTTNTPKQSDTNHQRNRAARTDHHKHDPDDSNLNDTNNRQQDTKAQNTKCSELSRSRKGKEHKGESEGQNAAVQQQGVVGGKKERTGSWAEALILSTGETDSPPTGDLGGSTGDLADEEGAAGAFLPFWDILRAFGNTTGVWANRDAPI
ncbi:hypothetical protein BDV18DRAFT_163453 [Aspergillus unguis]